MQRFGLYGGSFDPIHLGHIRLIEQLLQLKLVDEVCFMPAAIPPHKQHKELVDSKTRLEMIQLAISNQPHMTVSNYEIANEGISYTYKTLVHLRDQFPNKKIVFIMGSDSLWYFHKWFNFKNIINEFEVLIYQRPDQDGNQLEDILEYYTEKEFEKIQRSLVQAKLFDVSSTKVREAILNRQSIHELVPKRVEDFIIQQQLYLP